MTNHESQGAVPPELTHSVRKGSLMLGLCLAFLLPMGLAFVFWVSQSEFLAVALMVIGLSQLAYIVPLAIYYKIEKASRTLQGLLIGAGIVFLLNAACFGIAMNSLSFH